MPKDLVILVADKNMDHGVRGLLSRPTSLGIREIQFDTFVHSRHDPGCAGESHNFLRPFKNEYSHAIVMFDRHGSGRERWAAGALSEQVRQRLAVNGWDNRAEVIVLDPELEVWVFSESPLVEYCLGWRVQQAPLRNWLQDQGLWTQNHRKPVQPRRALEEVLKKVKKPRSSAIYMTLGKRVGLQRCQDPGFLKFRAVLTRWFPAERSN